jgi:hypothetical protein
MKGEPLPAWTGDKECRFDIPGPEAKCLHCGEQARSH